MEYGLIAYVTNSVGEFVTRLRRQLQPEEAAARPHLSLLPPRLLRGAEAGALELIEQHCQAVQPFEISLSDVESFMPRTSTVFLRAAHGAYRMRELHDRLNTGALQYDETFPYMPHLTIFRMDEAERAQHALQAAQQRWAEYDGSRRVLIDQLTFVRGSRLGGWTDIAPVPLGRRPVSIG